MKTTLKTITAVAIMLLLMPTSYAQVKIGDNPKTINENAILEMETDNKGMLLPRVSLTGTVNAAPMTAHVKGMAVYNVATVGDVTPGYYYNDGTKWSRLKGSSEDWTAIWYGFSATVNSDLTGGNVVKIGEGGSVTPNSFTIPISGLYKVSAAYCIKYQAGIGDANFVMKVNNVYRSFIFDHNVTASDTKLFTSTIQYQHFNEGDVVTTEEQYSNVDSGASVATGSIEIKLIKAD